MFRMFSFLPPVVSYVLALGVLGGTYYLQAAMGAADPETDTNRIWLVGGIFAFLLAFGGFQRGMEQRVKSMQPRVSSADVMQKLAGAETAGLSRDLDLPSHDVHAPQADSPLGRVRARSVSRDHHGDVDEGHAHRAAPGADTPLGRLRARSNPIEQS